MKRTEPTRSLLQGAPYINAASTDIRARFEAIKAAENAKKANAVARPRLHRVKPASWPYRG